MMRHNFKRFMVLVGIVLLSCLQISAQSYSGTITDRTTNRPISYVNIGVVAKNVGTVADVNGNYRINLVPQFDNDLLQVSCIGYKPFQMKVADFKNRRHSEIKLEEQIFETAEVVVKPRVFKHKRLGITTKSKTIQAGFNVVELGYEFGLLFNNKKTAKLEKLHLNIARCTFDTVFYRVNIYSKKGKKNFDNILRAPIYFEFAKEQIADELVIDLEKYNLLIEGDFLITIEHVKELGKGQLLFCAGLSKSTYYRKTSQGTWNSAPIGISLSVEANVEQ